MPVPIHVTPIPMDSQCLWFLKLSTAGYLLFSDNNKLLLIESRESGVVEQKQESAGRTASDGGPARPRLLIITLHYFLKIHSLFHRCLEGQLETTDRLFQRHRRVNQALLIIFCFSSKCQPIAHQMQGSLETNWVLFHFILKERKDRKSNKEKWRQVATSSTQFTHCPAAVSESKGGFITDQGFWEAGFLWGHSSLKGQSISLIEHSVPLCEVIHLSQVPAQLCWGESTVTQDLQMVPGSGCGWNQTKPEWHRERHHACP